MTNKFCCINVTLAARLIGMFDLLTSTLAINFLIGEFLNNEKQLLAFENINIFLGINWARILMNNNNKLEHTWILACLLFYSILYFICSSGLILATFSRNKKYAVPWLTFEIISIANQGSVIVASFIEQYFITEISILSYSKSNVTLASFYLLLSSYFWIVVFMARESWAVESLNASLESNESTCYQSHSINIDSSKTPSVIMNRIQASFESPQPPINSRYYEL